MKKYRIKTEDEFIKESGEVWKENYIKYWNSVCCGGMDYLFGRELTENEAEEIFEETYVDIDGWSISKDMITEVKKGDKKMKTKKEEKKVEYKEREIVINILGSGFTAKVGCQFFAFSTKKELLQALEMYIDDPEKAEKKYLG